ncbi:MAG: hypothetical protein F6J93_07760 [Oscillatoria sp. SIO1A7]|nr:hypothetical protein [Oscillatoria sp. SIO1A7]
MNYTIPTSPQKMVALQQQPVNEELVAAAIADLVRISRSQGKSLEEVTAEVLAEDYLLEAPLRQWLSEAIVQAWDYMGEL